LPESLPRWLKHYWLTAILWSSEPACQRAVREAIRTMIFRCSYVQRHCVARSIRQMLVQEGTVLARAGCIGPILDADDIEYTRVVLEPFLDAGASAR
jgi:hypothetical protein